MAKRFVFSLQPVLRYREMIENEKKKVFAIANRAVEEQRLLLSRLADNRQAMQEEVRGLYTDKAPFDQVIDAYQYITNLARQATQGEQVLATLSQTAEEKRQALLIAQKDRKALDILKEKRQAEHAHEVAREEQHDLDALGVMVKRRRDAERRMEV